MNGFKMLSDSYKVLVERGQMDAESAAKEIRICDFLDTCDTDDFCRLVNSGAFNDIIRGYVQLAVENAGVDEKAKEKVLAQSRYLFDEKTAKEVLEAYYKR